MKLEEMTISEALNLVETALPKVRAIEPLIGNVKIGEIASLASKFKGLFGF